MNISKIFIERPVMTILIMISIAFFGILAYKILPVSNLPCVEYPVIQIETHYPGANPETMANTITLPLERQFAAIDGIQTIASSSKYGQSMIVLQFNINKDLNVAATDVQTAINRAQPYLPNNLPSYPIYKKINPSQIPVIYLALSSDLMSNAELYNYAYSLIGRRLKMVEGVSNVEAYGSPFAIRIQVDPDYLAAHSVSINEVATAISQNNPSLPVGNLYGPTIEYTIDINGQMSQAEEYNNLIIRNNHHALLRIKDLGVAHSSLQNDKQSLQFFTKHSNKPSVIIAISKQPKANAIHVINGIKNLFDKLKWELPSSVELHTIFDQSQWIVESIHDMQFTLIVAFLLVVLVILFYLGKIRDTIIPLLSLPMSIIGTFAFMYLFGFNIDILSLLAITLSMGFLIDDAIVVLENINRHFEMGKSRKEATLQGSKQINFTILAMTLSLACVFIPMMFIGGILGNIFREFTITIFSAVLLSGAISLSLTPLLCSRFLSHYRSNGKTKWIEIIAKKLHVTLLNLYKRGLNIVFKHRFITLMIGIASVCVTIYLTLSLPIDFIPSDDLGCIQGFALASDQTSPHKMVKYQHKISETIKNNPNVQDLVSIGAIPNNNQALLFIRLKPFKKRMRMSKIIQEILEKTEEIPGVQLFLHPIPLLNLNIGTQASMGKYQYILQGTDKESLYADANKILNEMRTAHEFTQVSSDMHNNAFYATIHIDRNRASDLNISMQSIEETLQCAYSSKNLSFINGANNQYKVIIETLPNAYKDPSVLNKLYIPTNIETNKGYPKQVPLSSIASWEQTTGPASIAHINALPSVTISYNLAEGIPLSVGLSKLQEISSSLLSTSTQPLQSESFQSFKNSIRNFFLLFLITIFAIYVILGILYENFIHPLTVMSALPPAMLGAILTLLLFQQPLSLYAFVGIIMLLGIVLKNGILLVDFANEGIKNGMKIYDAMYEACTTRFRPILMTTLSAMMGAIPIALGIGGSTAQSRRPLGLVIIGGLIISQILTLYFTPIIFTYLEKLRRPK